MAHAQPRKQETTFRSGLQQLKHDYFGGQKVRPTNAEVTGHQSSWKCSGITESSSKYPAEQENAYEQDVSEHEYISEEDDHSSYRKVSEIGRYRHGIPESLPYGQYKTTEHKMMDDESEYIPRKASDNGYKKVAQNSRIVKYSEAGAGMKQHLVPSNGGGRMTYEDRVEENYRRKVQAPPMYEREKLYGEFMVDKKQEVPISQGGGRIYEDRCEENYRRKVQAPPLLYGREKMQGEFMVDKKQEVPISQGGGRMYKERVEENYRHKVEAPPMYGREKMQGGFKKQEAGHRIKNGYYHACDAEYAPHGHKTTYNMPQPDITDDEEIYDRRTEQCYENTSGLKYLRPAYWKQEVETFMGTEQISEKKSVKTKKDTILKIDISGKLKL